MTSTRTGWRFALAIALISAASPKVFSNADLIPPQIETKTATGVSLSDGAFTFTRTDLSIGTLTLERFYRAPVSTYSLDPAKQADASIMFHGLHSSNNFDIFVMPASRRNDPNSTPTFYARPIVHIGDSASGMYVQYSFASGSSVYANTPDADAGKLEWVGTTNPRYRYTDASGTVYNFNPSVDAAGVSETAGGFANHAQRIESIQYPDGRVRSFSYVGPQLKLVTDSTGYAIVFDWNVNGYISAACGFNLSQTYVTTATTCSGQDLKVTYTYAGTNNDLLATVTDVLNETESYAYSDQKTMTCLKPPGFSTCAISNAWGWSGSAGEITQTLIDGTSWRFNWTFWDQTAGGRRTDTEPYGDDNVEALAEDPAGNTWGYGFSGSSPRGFSDPDGGHTSYEFMLNGSVPYDDQPNWPAMHMGATLIKATFAEGNAYLTERNGPYRSLTKETWRAKPGSGQPDIVKQYGYTYPGPVAQITKPTSVIDGRGNQTDFTYASHGGVLSEMQPAPAPGAARPLKLYTYTQKYAYIKNSSGSLVQAAAPVWLPATVTVCQTAAGSSTPTCDSGAMQTVTTFEYGADGTANNLNLRGEVVSWNGQTRRTCYGYDNQGNKLWEIRPRAGLSSCPSSAGPSTAGAFTWAWRYDEKRRVTGTLAPDPDGAGPLHYAATRNTYDAAGRLARVESGELASWLNESTKPASWTGFTKHTTLDTSYDGLDRKTLEKISGSDGIVFSATQYSYDNMGRLECTAVRMNPATYGSLPASACTLGTSGSFGQDRITRNEYTFAGKLKKVQRAYGTSLQQDYATYTHTANGKVSAETDANGNLSQRSYDGYDRLVQLNFPSKTAAGSASGTDYEQYGYDANGNRTFLRKRDGQTISYTYDTLNRQTLKDVPGTANDVYYGYDHRGLMLSSRYGSTSGLGITTTYDGFGGKLTSTDTTGGFSRSLGYQYDADGNRTRLTYPDGNYFSYGYDGLDRMTGILQNGSTTVSSLAYNARGLRSSLTGGVSTSYGFNAAGRLSSVSHDLAGTTQDVGFTLSSYNPASQLLSQTRNNDSYAYAGIVTGSQSYSANGLNQYTVVGGASATYDDNANLTSDGSTGYGYDIENRLTSVTGASSASLSYDPMGRLFQISGSSTTQFLYDGDQRVAEYDASGTLLRRYVHGPGTDEPLLWYEGSGLTDRRILRTDHQGSVIAVADSSGNSLGINGYDEFGRPGSSNLGSFQYTGQVYLQEIGLYYYKARVYDPKWGRFLQTDPIGYTDDYNLYAYVGNDPVNKADPTGMVCSTCTGSITGSGVVGSGVRVIGAMPSTNSAVAPVSADGGAAAPNVDPAVAAGTVGAAGGLVEHGSAGLKVGFRMDGSAFSAGDGARVYGSNFHGNKVTEVFEIAKYGRTLGVAGAGAGVITEVQRYTAGDSSPSRAALNVLMIGVGLQPFGQPFAFGISAGWFAGDAWLADRSVVDQFAD